MKYKTRDNRLPIVAELYQLHIPIHAIASALKISVPAVGSDLRKLGLVGHHVAQKDVFSQTLKRYAELKTSKEEHSSCLGVVLESQLRVSEIIQFIRGLQEAMSILSLPQTQKEHKGYIDLLFRVFPVVRERPPEPSLFWDAYILGVNRGSVSLPCSRENLLSDIANRCVNQGRTMIAPIWPEYANQVIERVIDTLDDERQAETIRLYFGLGENQPYSLDKIGQRFGLSRTRVAQIKEKALRRLRHPKRSCHLKHLVAPVNETLDSLRQTGSAEELVTRQIITEETINLLHLPIEQLELSVRTYNALFSARIKNLGELTQHSETELLKYRNFGRKCLNEITDILHSLGLHLAMRLPPELKERWRKGLEK